ncbi:T9SS type A sorting domain-containing protein [Hymenobacter cellulosivorans]|uniref:T9SS type A sorting domain-containing protein n=1 Tax=Hymenobacter cellulosivorans TaxID=2932249 RepID=A0ABY4F670_9BACT|nr:T9SS type A sorting domain-containing protein [Hymenobacter cellulosivorans]UOQ51706.1 T9SS type A sorting domain-containing protein [Hymenobacter cellulosivorans]
MSTTIYATTSRLFGKVRARLAALATVLLLAPAAWAQAPANDDCAGAIALPITATCTPTTTTNLGATASTGAPTSPCGGTVTNDVWYSIVVPASGGVIVTTSQVSGSPFVDSILELYAGSCGSLTPLACSDDAGPDGFSSTTVANLPVGSTIYARVFSFAGSPAGSFGLCAVARPAVPANDNCSGAIALTPSATCTPTTVSNVGATTSTGVPTSSCASTVLNDIWYSIVVPTGGGLTVTTSSVSGSPFSDSIIELYSGACGSLTPVACNDDAVGGSDRFSSVTARGLTAGSTVYARVFGYSSTPTGQFGICVTVPVPPPANDDPAGAIALSLAATCTPTTGTNANTATTRPNGYTNGVNPNTACGIATAPRDVWYTFTTAASGTGSTAATIRVTGNAAGYIRVFSSAAGAAGPFTEISCASGGASNTVSVPLNLTGLTPGTTYYVSVAGYDSSDEVGPFTICVTSTPVILCIAPTAVSVGSITATSASLNFAAGAGNTSYRVTYYPAMNSTNITTLTPTTSPVPLVNLLPSTEYLVTLQPLCSAGGTTPLITQTFTTAPTNDECATAVTLTPGATCTPTDGKVLGATQSLAPTTCNSTLTVTAPDVWYSFTATATAHIITTSGDFDGVLEVLSGTCGSLTSVDCSDASADNTESLKLLSLTPGTTYKVRYYPYYDGDVVDGNFSICVTTLPANDAAVQAIYSLGTIAGTYSSPVTVRAVVRNNGGAALTNVPVTLTVSGATTYTDTKSIPTLAVGDYATVTFTSYPVTATSGTNQLTVTVPADGLATNNSRTMAQVVSAATLSYNVGNTFADGAGVTAANTTIAVRHEASKPATIRSITTHFFGGGGGNYQLLVFLADAPGGMPGTVIYATPARPRPISGGADVVAIPEIPVEGTFFVGLSNTTTNNLMIGYQRETPLRSGTFLYRLSGAGSWTDISATSDTRLAVDVTLGTVLASKDAIGAGTLNVYPNPAHRSFTLTLPAIAGQRTAALTLLNTLGQQVLTRTLPLTAAGTEAQVDVSNLAPGLYTLQIKTNQEVATKKVVLE